ncbi:hypothetical protein HMPREF1544_02880 [Mucor circinelloides 1006PhL]|uniref:CCHC-type domain-containing protein n=1 Tax=Mucor circinelloides f. circinelloides (strain 1006PhL) TaxID=1220926 RepID=S2JK91_MUCC1|nr:hypothetical protein HMPREF1544_02880 [Mucor circinelloides 1006PhL]KAG1090482.1 hypothetical protein G6F42_019685 [Rhizopus arrhizus]
MPKFDIPKFSTKEDPELWLYRYDNAAEMNEWDEKVKLNYVDKSFEENLQLWFMRKNFKSWTEFKAAFLSKHAKKVDLSKVIADITNIKMGINESVNSYIKRFEKKRGLYDNEIITKRKLTLNKNKPLKSAPAESKGKQSSSTSNKESDIESDQEGSDTTIELIITEAGLIKCFTKGLNSKTLKRDIKARKFGTLENLLKWLRDLYDSDDSDDVLSGESDTEPAVEHNIVQDKLKSDKHVTTRTVPKPANEDVFTSAMNSLSNDFKNMTLLLGEMNLKLSNTTQTVKKKSAGCYNCGGLEHFANSCTAPCKLCGSLEHRHYQCQLYKNNAGGYSSKQGPQRASTGNHNENMLIEEEVYLSEKRKHEEAMSEANNPSNAKRAPLRTRSGLAYGVTSTQGNVTQKSVPVQRSTPIIIDPEPQGTSDKTLSKRPFQAQPQHPLLPLEQPGDKIRQANFRVENIVDRVLNEPVHSFS